MNNKRVARMDIAFTKLNWNHFILPTTMLSAVPGIYCAVILLPTVQVSILEVERTAHPVSQQKGLCSWILIIHWRWARKQEKKQISLLSLLLFLLQYAV